MLSPNISIRPRQNSATGPATMKPVVMKRGATPALAGGLRKRILLVDSDPNSQQRRAGILRQHGVEVVCAPNIEHARLLWQVDTYNLVIIDATNVYDSAMAFRKLMKEERPAQVVTFLVGKPGFLSDLPLKDDVPAGDERSVSVRINAPMLLANASGKFSRGTGIMNAASQITARRSLDKLRFSDRTIAKAGREFSFSEAVRRADSE